MNDELRVLAEQDQADRRHPPDYMRDHADELLSRDRVRRQRVEQLLASGAATEGVDYFRAALIFQHAEELSDYWRAYELAQKAAELGY